MQNNDKKKTKNFRKRSIEQVEDVDNKNPNQQLDEEDEEERRLALEEVKLLQKQRERKSGIPAYLTTTSSSNFTSTSISGLQSGNAGGGLGKSNGGTDKNSDADGGGGGGEKEELVLQDTFAQETAVMVEDPNMLKYVERELAKKRGKNIDASNQAETDLIRADDELYKIPEHLKVKRRNSEESSTQWTTGIAEIQLPIEFKLKNIEETEAAKKVLQDKRLSGRTKTESSIPSSYSADYFQRGKDHAEKLRKENAEPHKEKVGKADGVGSKPTETTTTTTTTADAAGRREVASDQFMLERFRKRERHRVMRR